MNKPTTIVKTVFLLTMLGTVSTSSANFFGNNGFGNFFGGNNNSCNSWPVWTPMYWMEEMTGSSFGNGFGNNGGGFFGNNNNNRNCYNNNGYNGGNYNRSYGNYPSPYLSPYGAGPYMTTNPYAAQQQAYAYRPPVYNSYPQRGFTPYSGSSGFPNMGGNSFASPFSANPFSSFGGASSPFSSFGGGSPFSSFGSPMSGMSPMGMGGFGSPMSPMSMGTMGMPGMSPMSSFGGSPFGGSSFMPLR